MESRSRPLVGCSGIHNAILEKLTKVASTDAEILITGPSGVGKELYAAHVHAHSYRRDHRFVPVNCGSLSSELLENELFGHVGGAFTGARTQMEGLVRDAENGTLFLDEVNSLNIPCQIKLLRFLQDKKYRRLGETRLRQANVRIIAAANADLEAAVQEQRFRKDLFFRLRVVPIEIPALKERPEDIPVLLAAFTRKCAAKYKAPPLEFSDAAMQRIEKYDWPGNIRELENCVAYLTCLQLERAVQPGDLPLTTRIGTVKSITESGVSTPAAGGSSRGDAELDNFQAAKSRVVGNFEKQYIQRALQNTNGNVSAAARMSGKNRRALFELMRKYEIDPANYRKAPP
jgi:DNA-binding NtrC family response regulator